jgi:hypothetical protein
MKRGKKVPTVEVKRAFVVAQLVRKHPRRRYLGTVSKKEFEERLRAAKLKVLKMSEGQLDRFIGQEHKRRLRSYEATSWHLGEVKISEVGVWRDAGGLPRSWTNTNLIKTAHKVIQSLQGKLPPLTKRAKYSIENIINTNVRTIQREKYLLPIIFQGGTGTKGRSWLSHKTKWDIDDGCMRSIALAASGKKTIKAYIGTPIIDK